MEPLTFAYGRGFFVQRFLGWTAVFAVLLVLLAFQTQTPPEWIALLGLLLVAYLVVVGASPLATHHTLTRSRVILRQGWYFRAILPLAEVERATPWDGDPKYGIRISPGRDVLYVVGSKANLVSLRLTAPRRFALALFLSASEVVFDVDDRDAFLAAVEERRATGALPARKIHVLPPKR